MNHLLNFKAQFAEAVEKGTKRQTLRQPRKRPIKAGDTVRCYTGLRQKGARLLGVFRVMRVERVEIHESGLRYNPGRHWLMRPSRQNEFAQKDGFKDWPEMRDWFAAQYGLPVTLDLIEWEFPEGVKP